MLDFASLNVSCDRGAPQIGFRPSMSETFLKEDSELNLFRRTSFVGIDYSDGNEVEQRIDESIRGASDRSTFSNDVLRAVTDWPSEYHLSRQRHCLVRPLGIKRGDRVLELGAGCGAITLFLGEIGADVTAVEGSPLRARIAAERCRDLLNVKVVIDDLMQFAAAKPFDWVLLIGVLEYAPTFCSENDPTSYYLRRAKSSLSPNGGKLVVAIETNSA